MGAVTVAVAAAWYLLVIHQQEGAYAASLWMELQVAVCALRDFERSKGARGTLQDFMAQEYLERTRPKIQCVHSTSKEAKD